MLLRVQLSKHLCTAADLSLHMLVMRARPAQPHTGTSCSPAALLLYSDSILTGSRAIVSRAAPRATKPGPPHPSPTPVPTKSESPACIASSIKNPNRHQKALHPRPILPPRAQASARGACGASCRPPPSRKAAPACSHADRPSCAPHACLQLRGAAGRATAGPPPLSGVVAPTSWPASRPHRTS